MARMVILGHGGFDTKGFWTLVPPETTVKFFADAGSRLMLPSIPTGPANPTEPHWVEGQNCAFDYARVADLYSTYMEKIQPVNPGGVVENMLLQAPGAESQRIAKELHDQGKWGGELLMKPDAGEWQLCHGTETTCPTPKLHVTAKRHDELVAKGDAAIAAFNQWFTDGHTGPLPEPIADFGPRLADVPEHLLEYVGSGVPEKAYYHECGGILDIAQGKEVYWIACSGFEVSQAELDSIGLSAGLPSEMTAPTDGPGARNDWVPDDNALAAVTKKNGENVKATADGDSVGIAAGGLLAVIGDGHDQRVLYYIGRQGDLEEGEITVTKGGAFSKGGLTVKGISGKRDLVKTLIAEFSDKKVTFT